MIKEQDIRIGDIVKVSCDCILPEGSVCVVTQINTERFCKNRNGVVTLRYADGTDYVPWGVWCNSIEGIPLTPKILENNCWKLYEPSTKMYIKSNSNLAVCFPPHSDKVQVYYVVEHLHTIKYVHEFQHILWALGMDADLKIPEKSDGKEAKHQ